MAREMEQLSPTGWMINFTNPSGLVTEALNSHTKMRMIGLCNSPITYQTRFAQLFGVSRERIYMDYFGLNHLSWIRKVYLDGKDVMDIVLDKVINGEAEDLPGYVFNKKMLKALGMIPNGYLMHFYHGNKILDKLMHSPGRAETVMKIDRELMELYKNPELNEKPKILEQRGGAWYSDAAVALMSAMVNDKKEVHIVNVRNQGCLPGLTPDSVVEVPAMITGAGPFPLGQPEMPLGVRGLVQMVKAYEQLTVEAAVHGSRDAALLALANHPLVPNVDVAEKLLDRLIEENLAYLPQFS
jgi:6-phospho-beta-glucosidase